MLSAMIFDIERNSYVDGPGIRTAVFFKGCPLSCVWCHNPESQSFEKQMMFYKSKCIGCGKCAESCPPQIIRIVDAPASSKYKKQAKFQKKGCISCFCCQEMCPMKAISVKRAL